MKMRYYEVGIGKLPVEWRHGEHDAGKTRNQKLKKEGQAEQHRYPETKLAAPDGAKPVENLDPGRHPDQHRRRSEKRIASRRHTDRKHVMRPHAHADERDRASRRYHHVVAENHLAREHRNDLGRKSKGRDDQDVNLGMPEDPEKVLPQY